MRPAEICPAKPRRFPLETFTASIHPSGGRMRVRLSFPSVFCQSPFLALCRTAPTEVLSRSAASLYVNHSPGKSVGHLREPSNPVVRIWPRLDQIETLIRGYSHA